MKEQHNQGEQRSRMQLSKAHGRVWTNKCFRVKVSIQRFAYFLLCAISFFLAFERAAEMYITVDEAITYTDHIRPRLSGLLDFSAANNHFLNTFLAKLLTVLAPYSELALRLPTLIIGGWFFILYIPKRFEDWSERLLFASFCLYPYYISEYWSLSRGYFMSSCFAAAALIETSRLFTKRPALTSAKASRFFAGLSVLSSFVMLPFCMVVGLGTIIKRKDKRYLFPWKDLLSDYSFWFILLSCALASVGIYTFKTSGEVLAHSKVFSFTIPIGSVVATWVTGSTIAWSFFNLVIITSITTFIFARDKRGLLVALIIFSSLCIIWLGGSLGTGFPVNRSWIPYWFPICLIMSHGIYKLISLTRHKPTAATIPLMAACITLANNLYWYTPEYIYSWRTNYYQVKALMYHSSTNRDFCLEDAYMGDRVLIYYWDDPKSAITRPRECGPNESSPYGFTNFAVPGNEYNFPTKIWGKYQEPQFNQQNSNKSK